MSGRPDAGEQGRSLPVPSSAGATLCRGEVMTPLGVMQLTATLAGLASARFLAQPEPWVPSPGVDAGAEARAHEHLAQASAELLMYFSGELTNFGVPLDLGSNAGFPRDVMAATRRIPYGRIATYSEVAAWAGIPPAARAVTILLNVNRLCVLVPCHRVIPHGGGLGGYAGGVDVKEQLLRLEGVSLR